MDNRISRRGIRAAALVFLSFTSTLAGTGCGKDGGGDLTSPPPSDSGPSDPGPSDPGPSDPGPGSWSGPAPVGEVMYAVDLGNNFLVFGSESFNVLTAKMKITGLPILKRIIGITIRPSNGKLYGVGNDSRVYTIDPLTAVATPVGSGTFSLKIFDAFDIHFAMDLEPNGDRVRLIAAESGANWSISLDDGTATTGETSHYAAGTKLEGQTPRLLGMAYATVPDSAKQPGMCGNLAYAIDADEAIMIAACDPDTGEWWPTGKSPETSSSSASTGMLASASASPQTVLEDLKDQLARCGEFMPPPGGLPSPGERKPPEGGPWFPGTPDGPLYVFLVSRSYARNSMALVEAMGLTLGVTVRGDVPSEEPIQSVAWVHPQYVPHPTPPPDPARLMVRQESQLSVARIQKAESSAPPSPQTDPRARCGR